MQPNASYKQQEIILRELLPLLSAVTGKKTTKPKVKFYDSLLGVRHVLSNTLNCEEKIRRDLVSVENLVDFIGLKFINQHIKERVRKKIKVRSLRTLPIGSKISEKDWFLKKDNEDLLREVRQLNKTIRIEPLIMIYDSTVAIISSKKESYALEIESQELSLVLKMLFDIAWEQTKS